MRCEVVEGALTGWWSCLVRRVLRCLLKFAVQLLWVYLGEAVLPDGAFELHWLTKCNIVLTNLATSLSRGDSALSWGTQVLLPQLQRRALSRGRFFFLVEMVHAGLQRGFLPPI